MAPQVPQRGGSPGTAVAMSQRPQPSSHLSANSFAVQFHHVLAAGALVQAIHVLRDQRQRLAAGQLRQRRVAGFGCAAATISRRCWYHFQTMPGWRRYAAALASSSGS